MHLANLYRFLKSTKNLPFSWGTNDCCTLACGAINALHNTNPIQIIKSGYSTRIGSLRALRKEGFDNLEQAYDSLFTRVELSQSKIGDPILFTTGSMGVKTRLGAWVITDKGGIETVLNIDNIKTIWSAESWQ